jgi:hypothetical protein
MRLARGVRSLSVTNVEATLASRHRSVEHEPQDVAPKSGKGVAAPRSGEYRVSSYPRS